MILIAAVLLGGLVTWTLGGDLTRLADLRLRFGYLVFASLGLQMVLFTRIGDGLKPGPAAALHVATYVLLLVFMLANIRRTGVWLLTVGLVANTVVIGLNGGRMPVTAQAWRASGLPIASIARTGHNGNNVLIGAHTALSWLGDRFALPAGLPGAAALSAGDVLIMVGVIAFMYRVCAPPAGDGHSSVLAPLRSGPFRQVLAGRLSSTFGDWLAMTAIVTWTFAETRSTAAVSVFLVARIAAAIAGSTLSAPLLDRFTGFRLLAEVEVVRGLVTAAMIPLAAGGHVLAVGALVCLSAFLGSATGPSARSLVPEVVPDEQLHQANALHGVARNTTLVAGSLVAAISVVGFGITAALWIDVASFVVAAGLYARFRCFRLEGARASRQPLHSIGRMILARRTAAGLIGSFTIATAAIGLLNASLPDLLLTRFHEAAGYGYAMAAIGAGLMAGELLSGFIRQDMIVRRSIPIGFTVSALLILLLADSPLLATALLALGLLGVADGVTEITYDTLLQRAIPAGSRAGAFALGSAVQNAGMIAGLGAAALFASSRHAALVAAVAGLAAVPVAVVGLLPRSRRRRSTAAGAGSRLDSVVGRIATPAGVHPFELIAGTRDTAWRHHWPAGWPVDLLGRFPGQKCSDEVWRSAIHAADRAAHDAARDQLRQGLATDLEYRLCLPRGGERWVWERCYPRPGEAGELCVDGVLVDIDRHRRLRHELDRRCERLAHLAGSDPLTGLANRRQFASRLESAISDAAQTGTAFAVVFIDLDRFKQVNDRLGHAAGDDLLMAAAARLRAVAARALPARLGGDEFVVLTLTCPTPGAAREDGVRLRNQLVASLSRPHTLPEYGEVAVTASAGIGVYPIDGHDADALVRHADRDMYLSRGQAGFRAA